MTEEAPRVYLEGIEAKIKKKYFMRLGDAIHRDEDVPEDYDVLNAYTMCVLVMENDFVVTGSSAPVSLANFDQAKGEELAYGKAISKLWRLEGYLLREQLSKQ